MKGAIFKNSEINLWKKLIDEMNRLNQSPPYDTMSLDEAKIYDFKFILQTLKSYKAPPNGNGIQWSKEEKEKFSKLSYKEQRKMIVRKSELKSTLLPHVSVDYEPYKYSDRISDAAKRAYKKAQNLLETHKHIDFNSLDSKIQQEIFNNLRLAYKEQYLKAGVELAKWLFKKARFYENREKGEMEECARITNDLLFEKIPENSYMYYQLYKWARYEPQSYAESYINVNREQALECYNYALECAVWEAIDEEAQRENRKKTIYAAELYLAAAIKYQSPLAFYKAAYNYSPNDVFPNTTWCSLILHHACLRCSIALGGGGIDTIISYYLRTIDLPKSPLKANRLRAYSKKSPAQKGLINGLDPYFDEKFPPDTLIDFTSLCDICIYGAIQLDDEGGWMGICWAVEQGFVKDPRTKGSNLESIKEYYLTMWRVIVERNKRIIYKTPTNVRRELARKTYSNLHYGLPSARPYIFPKEVLDIEIDFNKGLKDKE
ncbi:hypothetical protein [uncultured Helicobacter sp.]|uniref:hypothetical protein n=1 Tax=uncultured Helicobacter sp. TaxID=175537 RepID=UPI00262E0A3D|nr:hypothetical protein [uncultured Helicobacter sp.]